MTSVSRSPATTWALVTTTSAAGEKPLPSWMRLHAIPSTFTVDAFTLSASAGVSPDDAGGGPMTGAGRRASNTRGKASGPTRRRSDWSGSGALGRAPSIVRARAELWACWAGQPRTADTDGSISHTATITPTKAAAAPPKRSTWPSGPGMSTRRNEIPATSPRPCPTKAAPMKTPAATNSRVSGGWSPMALMILGARKEAARTPMMRPIHDVARMRRPRR